MNIWMSGNTGFQGKHYFMFESLLTCFYIALVSWIEKKEMSKPEKKGTQ